MFPGLQVERWAIRLSWGPAVFWGPFTVLSGEPICPHLIHFTSNESETPKAELGQSSTCRVDSNQSCIVFPDHAKLGPHRAQIFNLVQVARSWRTTGMCGMHLASIQLLWLVKLVWAGIGQTQLVDSKNIVTLKGRLVQAPAENTATNNCVSSHANFSCTLWPEEWRRSRYDF